MYSLNFVGPNKRGISFSKFEWSKVNTLMRFEPRIQLIICVDPQRNHLIDNNLGVMDERGQI